MKRFLQIALTTVFVLFTVALNAQVTSSSMSGRVSCTDGTLPGASVVVKHVPSGTIYGTTTNNDGRYTIQGMRIGGPYKVEVSYVGYHNSITEGINLKLGETYILNIKMIEKSQSLESVEIVEQSILASEKTGATTIINDDEILKLPTISREFNDFTRLNPQSNGNGSFAGRDSRYNNYTVDGAPFNNDFGISSGLPGGGTPISIDAIEEIAVNVSSFDIRQSGFTGANINAVTKSGDNQFKGTAYSFLRPTSFVGKTIGEDSIVGLPESMKQLYGVSLGGAIVKDKLFFFVNGEFENEKFPSDDMSWNPSEDGVSDAAAKISRTKISDLDRVKKLLIDKYGFDPGEYQNRANFSTKSYRLLARLDWNINKNNKFTLRYNDVKTMEDNATNGNSGPSNMQRGSRRNSKQSIAFSNSNYVKNNAVRSITGELNSIINNKISNSLIASYTNIADKRSSPLDGTGFENMPFVDIWQDGDQYMSFGYELFTKNNAVINNAMNITDNVSFYLGNHTLTAGISFDYKYFKNSYIRYGTGYYRYDSVDDFINHAENGIGAPIAFSLTYGFNGNEAPGVELDFGYGAIYVQDEWSIKDNLRLTYGIRLEKPFYLNTLEDNKSNYKELEFADGRHVDLSKWPNSNISVSPRVGFNWDIMGDRSIIVRGGTGLYTGYLPFAWFTNQPLYTNVIQNTVDYEGDLSKIKFVDDYHDILNDPELTDYFPQTSDSTNVLNQMCIVDPDFKFPQIWRTNLAVDIKLPFDMVLTLEGLYSKDINTANQQNINEAKPLSPIVETSGAQRDSWWTKNDDGEWITSNRIHQDIVGALMLTNGNKGYQYSFTAQLDKKFSYGFSGMLAYTHSISKISSTNPGDASASAWSSNVCVNSLNYPELGYANFSVPNRVMGALTYSYELDKAFGFSLSLYYSGSAQDRYSYTYKNDLNGDGNASDLMYIPTGADDINFVDIVNSEGAVVSTAAQQAEALMNYINNDKYLSANKGKYAERFAAVGPWINRIDAKALINLFTNFGSDKRYTLQLSLDCYNIGNLFNSEWGVYKYHGLGTNNYIQLVKFAGMEEGGETPTPTYQLNATSVEQFNADAKFMNNVILSNAWQMLVGIRLLF